MNIRLNKRIKETIIANAIEKAGVNSQQAELDKKRFDLAEAIRIDAIGGTEMVQKIDTATLKIHRTLNEFPRNLVYHFGNFNTENRLSIDIDDDYYSLSFSEDRKTYRVCPTTRIKIANDSPFYKSYHDLDKEKNQINDKRQEIKEQVATILSQCNTINQLIKLWPEAEKLLPDATQPAKHLPAIPIDDVNKLIGLA